MTALIPPVFLQGVLGCPFHWFGIDDMLALWLGFDLEVPVFESPLMSPVELRLAMCVLLSTAVGLVGVIVWTVLAELTVSISQTPSVGYIRAWLWFYVRWSLSLHMIVYASAKFPVPTQMPRPTNAMLLSPIGESLPAALIWGTFGFAQMYQQLGGLAELMGALLLLSPRLHTLGALIIFVVMSQVFVLNLQFSIGVTASSAVCVVSAAGLLVADFPRQVSFYILGSSVPPQVTYEPLNKRPGCCSTLKFTLACFIPLTIFATNYLNESQVFAAGPATGIFHVHNLWGYSVDGRDEWCPSRITRIAIDAFLPCETLRKFPSIAVVLPESGQKECHVGAWSIQRADGEISQYNSIFVGDKPGPNSSSGQFLLHEGPAQSMWDVVYGATIEPGLWASVQFTSSWDGDGGWAAFTCELENAQNVTRSHAAQYLKVNASRYVPPLAQNMDRVSLMPLNDRGRFLFF